MRSYTSNSNGECPNGPWLKTWLVTIALALTLLLGWEVVLRRLDYRPTVVDDDALWASQRDRVYTSYCEKAIVLLGDCRTQLGLVPQILRDRSPRSRVLQLSIVETSPIAVLRDLAADESFHGTVICGLNARLMCKDMWDTQQPYVDYYHTKYGLNEKLNRLVSALVQRTFVATHPQLRGDDFVVHLAKDRKLPSPYYIETHADRSRSADYSRVDLEAHRMWALGRASWLCSGRSLPAPPQWLLDLREVEEWVTAIQARGGRVVFLRLPTTGQHYRYDEYIFPKARYWDAFVAQTSALCIHFKDVPQLSGFECPDTSHLDRTDAPRFTLELAKVLQSHGVLGAPPCVAVATNTSGKSLGCRCPHDGKHAGGSAQCPCCTIDAARGKTQSEPLTTRS